MLRLKHKGYRALPGIPPLPIVSQSIVIQSSYLAKNADKLENVLRALLEGVAFVLSPKNKAIVLRTLNKRLGISDSGNDEESYQHLLSTLERKPYTTLEAFNNIHRLMKVHNPKVGKLRPDDVLDNRFIRKLDESGFIDRMLMSYGVRTESDNSNGRGDCELLSRGIAAGCAALNPRWLLISQRNSNCRPQWLPTAELLRRVLNSRRFAGMMGHEADVPLRHAGILFITLALTGCSIATSIVNECRGRHAKPTQDYSD